MEIIVLIAYNEQCKYEGKVQIYDLKPTCKNIFNVSLNVSAERPLMPIATDNAYK